MTSNNSPVIGCARRSRNDTKNNDVGSTSKSSRGDRHGMNQVSEDVVVDDDVNNYFNESDPVIYIPVIINHTSSKNGNTPGPLPSPAPRTPAEMERHKERLNMRRAHDASMRQKSREEDTARKLQQQQQPRMRSASAGRSRRRPSPPDAVADPVVGDKGSIHPSPAALALLLNDNAKVITSGKRQQPPLPRQRQQQPPPATQRQRRSTDISELSMGSGRKRVDPEEVNSQALLRRHPELQGVQLPSVSIVAPTSTTKGSKTRTISPRGIEIRCKSVEPPSEKRQLESKGTSLVTVKASPPASLNNRESLKSRPRSKSMNARRKEEPVKNRVYTPPPRSSAIVATTSSKRVGKVEFSSNNNVMTKTTTTTRPTTSSNNNLAASSARLARRNAKVPPPPSSRRKESSSKTSEKEKEMNGDPIIMKSSSQMLFTKTMNTPRRKNSIASSTSKEPHRIGSHVRNLSNGGTVSTHPLTTNSIHEKNRGGGSSSRKGTHNTSMDDIDDDNVKDDDIEPESIRKVIIQHKKRASKRSTKAKEYDDDGNTIIKPMKCIELSSDEKSHASSISACSTSVSSENNDTSTKVSRSRSKSRSKTKSRNVSVVVDGSSSNGDTGEDGHGGRRTHSSKMIKDKALSALAGAKDGALHVAAYSKSAMDGWGKKGVSGRKWQSALFV